MSTALDVRPFKSPNNTDILNAIRKNASSDYQRRIPAADKANIQDTIRTLLSWDPARNELIDALVNQIGLVLVKNASWTNPLAKFKRGELLYGDTIEEINVGLIEARRYNSDRDALEKDIFGQYINDVQSSFHKINRQDMYPLTINESLLTRAFQSEFGLSSMLASLMTTPTTSDYWDEFSLTTSLFREYYDAGGFFKVNIGDLGAVDSTEATAKYALRRMREMAGNVGFINTNYNAAGMPVAALPDELELFITPEALAAIDVEALAGAFNVAKAEMIGRINVIPAQNFRIPGAQAILTSRDFFVIADNKIATTSAYNPVTLSTNYFLHHWQVVSASRFVPAILFTTEPGDVIVIEETPVTSVDVPTFADEDGNVVTKFTRGQMYEVVGYANTTPANGDNNAVRYTLTGQLSELTRVTQSGIVHVSIDEAAVSINVTITAVDSGIDGGDQLSQTVAVPVIGDRLILWPDSQVIPDTDADGLGEVTPEPLTVDADDNVIIPSVVGVLYKRAGAAVTNGSVQHITASTVFTAEARANYELATGATATWTLAP